MVGGGGGWWDTNCIVIVKIKESGATTSGKL